MLMGHQSGYTPWKFMSCKLRERGLGWRGETDAEIRWFVLYQSWFVAGAGLGKEGR